MVYVSGYFLSVHKHFLKAALHKYCYMYNYVSTLAYMGHDHYTLGLLGVVTIQLKFLIIVLFMVKTSLMPRPHPQSRRESEGLGTFERFLGCAESAVM